MMSIVTTKSIVPNKGVLDGAPELMPPGSLVEAENVVIHPTQGIYTRPGLETLGIIDISSKVSTVYLIKEFMYNNDVYLFVLGHNEINLKILLINLLNQSVEDEYTITDSEYVDYFKDAQGNYLTDPEDIVIQVVKDRIWIANKTKQVDATLESPTYNIIPHDLQGDPPMIVININNSIYKYNNGDNLPFDYSSTQNYINSWKAFENSIFLNKAVVSDKTDYVQVNPNSDVLLEISKEEPTNPWTFSTPPAPDTNWHSVTLHLTDGLIYFQNDGYPYLRFENIKDGSIADSSGILDTEYGYEWQDGDLGGTIAKAPGISNGMEVTDLTIEIHPNYRLKGIYYRYDDTHPNPDYKNYIIIDNVDIQVGNLTETKTLNITCNDAQWVTLFEANYLDDSQLHTDVIIQLAMGTGNHAAPNVNISLKTSIGTSLFSFNGYVDDDGYKVYSSDSDILNTLVVKLESVNYTYFNVDSNDATGIITVSYPPHLDFDFDIIHEIKDIEINKIGNLTYTLHDGVMPFYLIKDTTSYNRPIEFTSHFDYIKNAFGTYIPSFHKSYINDLYYTQNRFIMLTDKSILFSQINVDSQFYPDTLVTDSSPIDVELKTHGDKLEYILFSENNFYIFGKKSQYILHFSDYISPLKLVVKEVTHYNIITIKPQLSGRSVFFVGGEPRGLETIAHMYEYIITANGYASSADDKSILTSSIMPKNLKQIVALGGGHKVFLISDENDKTICTYYSRFIVNDQVITEGWVVWKMPIQLERLVVTDNNEVVGVTRSNDNKKILLHKLPLDENVADNIVDNYYTSDAQLSSSNIEYKITIPINTLELPVKGKIKIDEINFNFVTSPNCYVFKEIEDTITYLTQLSNHKKIKLLKRIPVEETKIILTNKDLTGSNSSTLNSKVFHLVSYDITFRVYRNRFV